MLPFNCLGLLLVYNGFGQHDAPFGPLSGPSPKLSGLVSGFSFLQTSPEVGRLSNAFDAPALCPPFRGGRR